jgi:dTDP-4-dehydrorhamnose reductase
VRRIIIIGAGGRLGAAVAREYAGEFDVTGFSHEELDLTDHARLEQRVGEIDFELLINCAALTNVDYCESSREEAFAINAEAPRVMAKLCAEKKANFIHLSTDYVFDGEKREPYYEEDEARPISVYGESKLRGEQLVLEANGAALVGRVSWVFGPDRPSFIDAILKKAGEEEKIAAVADKFATPTYTLDIAKMLRPFLAVDGDGLSRTPGSTPVGINDPGYSSAPSYSGILHLTNSGECSWQEYAQWALDCARDTGLPIRARTVNPLLLAEMKNFVARRPVYSVLSNEKLVRLTGKTPRDWRAAVADYIKMHLAR